MLPWIDLHPIHLVVEQSDTSGSGKGPCCVTIGSAATLKELIFEVAHHASQAPHKCSLRVTPPGSEPSRELDSKCEEASQTMEELGVTSEWHFFRLDSKNDGIGTSFGGYHSTYRSSGYVYTPPTSEEGEPPAEGVVGIRNLGNTCFMASALQCLVHIPPLRDFFLYGEYIKDGKACREITKRKGPDLAKPFAKVVEEMFNSRYTVVHPSGLKRAVGRYNPMFTGFQQHDSQEFLSCLLEGLHEELNIASNQASPTLPTAGESWAQSGSSTAEEARDALVEYTARQSSRVNDIFAGLYISSWSCALCGHTQRRFEPFKLVSLAVPTSPNRQIECVGVPTAVHIKPIRVHLSVPKEGTIDQVREVLRERMLSTGLMEPASEVVIGELMLNGPVLVSNKKRLHQVAAGTRLYGFVVASTENAFAIRAVASGAEEEAEIKAGVEGEIDPAPEALVSMSPTAAEQHVGGTTTHLAVLGLPTAATAEELEAGLAQLTVGMAGGGSQLVVLAQRSEAKPCWVSADDPAVTVPEGCSSVREAVARGRIQAGLRLEAATLEATPGLIWVRKSLGRGMGGGCGLGGSRGIGSGRSLDGQDPFDPGSEGEGEPTAGRQEGEHEELSLGSILRGFTAAEASIR